MKDCWKKSAAPPNQKSCDKAKCCYDAACEAVFKYEQFANSEYWEKVKAAMKELVNETLSERASK